MQIKYIAVLLVFSMFFTIIPSAFAEPTINIRMGQTTFSYGERLFYTIEVSEVTGDAAILHIRDDLGEGSSAIPIEITELTTPVSAPFAFDKEIFSTGKYYIDIEYSGATDTAEFNLIDSGKTVLPFWMKQIAYSWLNDQISSGSLIDAIQKAMGDEKLNPEKEIDKNNLDSIYIPKWVKTITGWWLEEKTTDEDFTNAIQYLIKIDAITI